MYCRKCKYDLHGTASPACPECGRAFDPADPRTWEPLPSQPRTSLVILVVALVMIVLTQLVLGVVRPLLPASLADLDWLFAALAPIGAFIAGWYAERRVALLVYGGLATVVIVFALNAREFGGAFVGRSGSLLLSSVWAGAALALMLGCWFVGCLAWRLRARIARRTSRRRWPRPRTIAIAVGVMLVLFVAWVGNETRQVMYGAPAWPSVDYDAQRHRLRLDAAGMAAAPTLDAWDLVERTILPARGIYRGMYAQIIPEGSAARHRRDGRIDLRYPLRGKRPPAELRRELALITAYREAGIDDALMRLREGPIPIGEASQPDLWSVWLVVQTTTISMRLAADDGDTEQVSRLFDAAMALLRGVSFNAETRIHNSVGGAQQMLLTELCREVMEYEFSEAVCTDLLETLSRRPLAPAELILECERLRIFDRLQIEFTDEGGGVGYRAAAGGLGWMDGIVDAFERRFIHPSRAKERALCDTAIDAAVADLAIPLFQRDTTVVRQVPQEIRRQYRVVSHAMAPRTGFAIDEAYRQRVYETARLVIAIARFRARHGRLPASLDALVPDMLDDVPEDPTTATAFGYMANTAETHGQPFVIYSYGHDRTDDGGVFDTLLAREPEGVGVDERMTLQREPVE